MNLQQYRNSLGLTQKEMSEALDIAQPAMARSEKNWPNVATSFLLKIVKVYGAPIIIDLSSGVRFALPGEIVTSPKTQDDIVNDLDYLPDV